MRIDKLIQGKDDRVIFGTVGSLLTDKKVHEELGIFCFVCRYRQWVPFSCSDSQHHANWASAHI